jgi:putative transposase
MRKYDHMGLEEFQEIYRRQKSSGLTVEDFCINECYGKSSFYYWKRKYISNPEEQKTEPIRSITEKTDPTGIAPIHIKPESTALALKSKQPVERTSRERSEISIRFPGGLKVTFRGKSNSRAAIDIITKIYSSDVLPE